MWQYRVRIKTYMQQRQEKIETVTIYITNRNQTTTGLSMHIYVNNFFLKNKRDPVSGDYPTPVRTRHSEAPLPVKNVAYELKCRISGTCLHILNPTHSNGFLGYRQCRDPARLGLRKHGATPLYFTAWRHASAVYAVIVCHSSVRHNSAFYQTSNNGRLTMSQFYVLLTLMYWIETKDKRLVKKSQLCWLKSTCSKSW